MNKKLFLLPILLLTHYTMHAFSWHTFYCRFNTKLQNEKNFNGSNPDFNRLKGLFNDKWDYYCKPGRQSYSLKNELNDYRNVSSSQIENYLEGFAEISEEDANEIGIKSIIIHILNLYKAKYIELFCKNFDELAST